MQTTLFSSKDRGTADYGWLKPNYYFSFSNYYHPGKIHFGVLRVLNDDLIMGGGAFPTHPHDNMEIVTIPLSGALQHKDNTGGEGIIKAGDIQIMSAGSGIQHSESNASDTEPVTLFQVWVFPKEKNITPRYDQRHFSAEQRLDQWQIVVSPLKEDNALWINQDARFALCNLSAGESIKYKNGFEGNGIFLLTIKGSVKIENLLLSNRDAVGISQTNEIVVQAESDAELLVIEIPMTI